MRQTKRFSAFFCRTTPFFAPFSLYIIYRYTARCFKSGGRDGCGGKDFFAAIFRRRPAFARTRTLLIRKKAPIFLKAPFYAGFLEPNIKIPL